MNPLHTPVRHDLAVLLKELKYGRPARDQIWLDEKIKELKGDTRTTSYSGWVGGMSRDGAERAAKQIATALEEALTEMMTACPDEQDLERARAAFAAALTEEGE
jgi:hypothetical protein